MPVIWSRVWRAFLAGAALLQRLATVANGRDIDALVDCFAPDYRNETPAHLGRASLVRVGLTIDFKRWPYI